MGTLRNSRGWLSVRRHDTVSSHWSLCSVIFLIAVLMARR
ncbi:hypothetical protein THTE_4168 [Thermogutta terrifontis]|uniref:Uncharacterized protein n=1 Tax=Thermogutta terrifontis TaxID=1331910 RepID=A0A286RLC7_9BACT|nr:hypothetical protein THTE_4168 [Thermogutta terrifontis]